MLAKRFIYAIAISASQGLALLVLPVIAAIFWMRCRSTIGRLSLVALAVDILYAALLLLEETVVLDQIWTTPTLCRYALAARLFFMALSTSCTSLLAIYSHIHLMPRYRTKLPNRHLAYGAAWLAMLELVLLTIWSRYPGNMSALQTHMQTNSIEDQTPLEIATAADADAGLQVRMVCAADPTHAIATQLTFGAMVLLLWGLAMYALGSMYRRVHAIRRPTPGIIARRRSIIFAAAALCLNVTPYIVYTLISAMAGHNGASAGGADTAITRLQVNQMDRHRASIHLFRFIAVYMLFSGPLLSLLHWLPLLWCTLRKGDPFVAQRLHARWDRLRMRAAPVSATPRDTTAGSRLNSMLDDYRSSIAAQAMSVRQSYQTDRSSATDASPMSLGEEVRPINNAHTNSDNQAGRMVCD
ncbi:hypothetical protein THASP1DRAFT_27064 [Thamnocephalis sphaerospora]|uniref:Uncharacterized protein n=1 Tax=Thamnocephalis sphaerospora TaxID=78915 RepID=A0A4P9XXN2_9FUNG|nr:hypothetical protein THASP1DRAFT_27064 [Thamnocephalis sphaerospora]|eukprot:RKP11146.1 hypothetical protein THASP1DRAFT_27064 [Thamnocephalis sphaerospora]